MEREKMHPLNFAIKIRTIRVRVVTNVISATLCFMTRAIDISIDDVMTFDEIVA